MGLFSEEKTKTKSENFDEAETIFLAMFLIATLKGKAKSEYLEVFKGLTEQIPIFRGVDLNWFKKTLDKVSGYVTSTDDPDEIIKTITKISPENANKLFVAVVECACASNGIDEAKKSLIEEIYEKLNIDKKFAKNVIEVVKVKYG